MANNTTLNTGSGGDTIATDDVAGIKYQRVKLVDGTEDSTTAIPGDATNGLDVDVTRVQGTVTVDSELPAAAALSDALDRATSTPVVGAAGLVDNGSNLQRLRTAPAATGTTGAGLLGTGLLIKGTSNYSDAQSAVVIADGATGIGVLAEVPMFYNGTNFDRPRNNTEGTVLASASRAATPTISNITNYNARGIRLFLNITVTPNNAETLTVSIEWVDPVSAAVKAVTAYPAITASGLGASPAAGVREFVYELYPGSVETSAVANHEVQGGSLPRTLHPKVTHSSTGSWTYSLGYGLVL